MGLKLAYGKIGRSIPLSLETAGSIGGDIEVVKLMHKLVKDGHEVHLVGRNRVDADIPGVINHWGPGGAFGTINAEAYVRNENRGQDDAKFMLFKDRLMRGIRLLPTFDAWVIWLGQHGTSCGFIPPVKKSLNEEFTTPLMSSLNYSYPISLMVNELNVRPIWLCPDPRNKLKLRDIASPNQRVMLGQYNDSRGNLFYDPAENITRSAITRYRYAGIEMLAVNQACRLETFDKMSTPTQTFGILVNEGPSNVKRNRADLVKSWLRGLQFEYEMFGHWSDGGMQKIGRVVQPVPVTQVPNVLRRWRATITFPASNTGWATSKPWECFAVGCVCFKHPDYDDQHHIYGEHMSNDLRAFLCPPTVTGFQKRVEEMKDENTYRDVANACLKYFWDSMERMEGGMREIRKEIRVVTAEAR